MEQVANALYGLDKVSVRSLAARFLVKEQFSRACLPVRHAYRRGAPSCIEHVGLFGVNEAARLLVRVGKGSRDRKGTESREDNAHECRTMH